MCFRSITSTKWWTTAKANLSIHLPPQNMQLLSQNSYLLIYCSYLFNTATFSLQLPLQYISFSKRRYTFSIQIPSQFSVKPPFKYRYLLSKATFQIQICTFSMQTYLFNIDNFSKQLPFQYCYLFNTATFLIQLLLCTWTCSCTGNTPSWLFVPVPVVVILPAGYLYLYQ